MYPCMCTMDFVWENHRIKVCCIDHIALGVCEHCYMTNTTWQGVKMYYKEGWG